MNPSASTPIPLPSAGARVVVGMSGGVDSSVAAYLLKQQGFEVIGVTMKVWPQDCISRAEDKCCGPQAIADARGVAHALGIPHYVVDEGENFERLVIDYFAEEYRNGRTPNPCVMCNEKVKFGNLWGKARSLGAEYIATGHYAIIEHLPERAVLRKGRDPRKDQSYFLFSLRQAQLRRALCPLGEMSKPEIRAIARQLGLKVAEKQDSQEICFVPGNDYKAFLKSHLGANEFHRGGIYDKAGTRLAEHEGIELFTIGQRKGLPGGSPRPRYVIDIDPVTNSVIVGEAEDLITGEFTMDHCGWHEERAEPFAATVKIRYAHPGTLATIHPQPGGEARVLLHTPQRAVTPGQAAVCYRGDEVLGGGWIARHTAVSSCAASGGRDGLNDRSARRFEPMSSTDQSQREVADRVLVVLTTWPDVEQARAASQALIGERLAACANILPGMESIYRWEGKVEANAEILVIFKTTAARYPALESRIRELHCYQVPEILALPVAAGLPAFLQWVEESCSTIQV